MTKFVVMFVPADGSSRPVFVKDMSDYRKVAMYTDRKAAERMASVHHKGEVVEYDPNWPTIHPYHPL